MLFGIPASDLCGINGALYLLSYYSILVLCYSQVTYSGDQCAFVGESVTCRMEVGGVVY